MFILCLCFVFADFLGLCIPLVIHLTVLLSKKLLNFKKTRRSGRPVKCKSNWSGGGWCPLISRTELFRRVRSFSYTWIFNTSFFFSKEFSEIRSTHDEVLKTGRFSIVCRCVASKPEKSQQPIRAKLSITWTDGNPEQIHVNYPSAGKRGTMSPLAFFFFILLVEKVVRMISDQSQRDAKLPGKKIQFKSNSPFFRQQSPSESWKSVIRFNWTLWGTIPEGVSNKCRLR